MYYVFDFTYEVTNNAKLAMPMSGVTATIGRFIPLACGFVLIIATVFVCYPVFTKRRKASRH